MEEQVGQLWDRLVTRAASHGHPESVVRLTEVAKVAGIFYRALSGDPGHTVEASTSTIHGARRSWLQRLAGTNRHSDMAWLDEQALRLPMCIDCFPNPELNRDLYLWLVALAAHSHSTLSTWCERSQAATSATLDNCPGLVGRYQRLVEAHIGARPSPQALPDDEAALERAIRQALRIPGSVAELPLARKAPTPVPLWLHPDPPRSGVDGRSQAQPAEPDGTGSQAQDEETQRRKAERVEAPERERGLVAIRMEALFSWAEHANLDRSTDEEDDEDVARRAADDMEVMSVARDQRRVASRVRFDLDLPAASCDDHPLGEGLLLPEWHYKKRRLLPEHCRLQPLVARAVSPCALPDRLVKSARRLRAQFEALAPARIWHRAQHEGQDVDLDAYLRFVGERATGHASGETGLYRSLNSGNRDLACVLLADLSLSTDTWINNDMRVIDVIRDSLFLFAESLSATGDPFALYGFSSKKRTHVRFHHIKGFREPYGGTVRGRIQALRPGFYTRMGAAVRQATTLLAKQDSGRRLLILLTDGKPNDLDQYEGRYGIEDTRMSIIEAHRSGAFPFCVTIDQKAGSYLPYVFGAGRYAVVRRPDELPRRLPQLYAELTR